MGSPNWTAYNAAQSEEKTRFVALLADLCNTIAQPEQGMGRPRGRGARRLCFLSGTTQAGIRAMRSEAGSPLITGKSRAEAMGSG
jgi:hypothetical protein